jgi:RNA polymerase sigma-32 factor
MSAKRNSSFKRLIRLDNRVRLVFSMSAKEKKEAKPKSKTAKKAKPKSDLVRLDSLQRYLNEIGRVDLLTAEEEHDLAVDLQKTQDPKLAYKLITANLRLVVKIALEHRNYYQNLLDLIQEGNIGLMQAVKKFDPYRGVRLPSYAQWWIRAYILKFILENFSLVKIGTTQAQRKLFFRLKKEQQKLLRDGFSPSSKLLAERIQVPEKEVIEMQKRLSGPEASLDATHPVTGRTFADTLVVEARDPEEMMATEELRDRVRSAMDQFRETLDEREQAIWDARISVDKPLTFNELGETHGITRQRVQQVEQRLKARFKEFFMVSMSDEDSRPRF